LTILITGGAGFIGTRLIASLGVAEDVVVVDNLHPQVHGDAPKKPHFGSNVRFVQGDVTNEGMWDDLLRTVSPATVVHLAAETGTGQSLLQASRHTFVNVHGTAVMLDAFARANKIPQSVILTSSRAVYGEGAWKTEESKSFYGEPRGAEQLDAGNWSPLGPEGETGVPLAHDARTVVPNPSNVYAATKLAQENILAAWCASMSVAFTTLRLQNVYGAGQALRNPYTGVLTFFARQALAGKPIQVYEGGGIIRDFVHVSDVVSAISHVVSSAPTAGHSRTIDIGSGASDTLLHFATVLSELASQTSIEITNQYRLGDVRAAFASNDQAALELNYSPRISFSEGAEELLTWAREEIKNGN
jgi:dTDP-L-rhamnose 4-epimerase